MLIASTHVLQSPSTMQEHLPGLTCQTSATTTGQFCNAISSPWSNGQTEGRITMLKSSSDKCTVAPKSICSRRVSWDQPRQDLQRVCARPECCHLRGTLVSARSGEANLDCTVRLQVRRLLRACSTWRTIDLSALSVVRAFGAIVGLIWRSVGLVVDLMLSGDF